MSRWIMTASGHELSLLDPTPATITLADISHSLAQLVRFTGHARRPYSVAEHSLLVCEIVERTVTSDPHALLAALLHDAHEAYTGDLHSPGKAIVGGAWRAFEDHLQERVRSAFAVHGPSGVWHEAIKMADLQALVTEREQLMPKMPWHRPWTPELRGIQPVGWVDLMDPARCAMTWLDWRRSFADRADELEFARNDLLAPHRRMTC